MRRFVTIAFVPAAAIVSDVVRCITTENILGPLIFSEHDTKPLKCIPSVKKEFKCHFDIENLDLQTTNNK